MKKIGVLFILVCCLLIGCAKAEDYQGTWYGIAADYTKYEVKFSDTELSIQKEGDTSPRTGDYKIIGKGFENEYNYILIEVEGDILTFGFADDKGSYLIIPDDYRDDPLYGTLIYRLHREDYPKDLGDFEQ